MIWDKLVLLEWFIRGLVSVNWFFLLFGGGFFFLLCQFLFPVLFGFQEKDFFFCCLFNTLIKLLCSLIQAYHCWY